MILDPKLHLALLQGAEAGASVGRIWWLLEMTDSPAMSIRSGLGMPSRTVSFIDCTLNSSFTIDIS